MKTLGKLILFLLIILYFYNLGKSSVEENQKDDYKELRAKVAFLNLCVDANDKCVASVDEFIDRNADTGTADVFIDSLENNDYFKYHHIVDSLYASQLKD